MLLEDYLRVRPDAARARCAACARRPASGRTLVRAGRRADTIRRVAGAESSRWGRADAERLGGRSDVLYSPDAFGHPAVWPALAARVRNRLRRALARTRRRAGASTATSSAGTRPTAARSCCTTCPRRATRSGIGLPVRRAEAGRGMAALRADARSSRASVVAPRGLRRRRPPRGPSGPLPAARPARRARAGRRRSGLAARRVLRGRGRRSRRVVPALRGELRWSYGYTWTLQGVHGTRAALKRRHAEAELWLERVAEPLAALAAGLGRRHPGSVLRSAWRTLLRSQFHDSIGGCTSDPVARRVAGRIDDAELMAREVARLSLDALIRKRSRPVPRYPRRHRAEAAVVESRAAEPGGHRRRGSDLVPERRAGGPTGRASGAQRRGLHAGGTSGARRTDPASDSRLRPRTRASRLRPALPRSGSGRGGAGGVTSHRSSRGSVSPRWRPFRPAGRARKEA